MNFMDLPEEVLVIILSKINTVDWYNIIKVCKKLYRICQDRDVCQIFWYKNQIKLYKILDTGDLEINQLLRNSKYMCDKNFKPCTCHTHPCYCNGNYLFNSN